MGKKNVQQNQDSLDQKADIIATQESLPRMLTVEKEVSSTELCAVTPDPIDTF